MKLIYKEPVIDEIQNQEEYLERNEDYDCAEAVMSAKWAVINAQEIEAIPIEWMHNKAEDTNRASLFRRYIQELLSEWQIEKRNSRDNSKND